VNCVFVTDPEFIVHFCVVRFEHGVLVFHAIAKKIAEDAAA